MNPIAFLVFILLWFAFGGVITTVLLHIPGHGLGIAVRWVGGVSFAVLLGVLLLGGQYVAAGALSLVRPEKPNGQQSFCRIMLAVFLLSLVGFIAAMRFAKLCMEYRGLGEPL